MDIRSDLFSLPWQLADAAAHASLPAAADAAIWFQDNVGIDYQMADDNVIIPQAPNYAFQWPGQMFNMPG
jgi:geranylgeranyl pyrophosphate synthase